MFWIIKKVIGLVAAIITLGLLAAGVNAVVAAVSTVTGEGGEGTDIPINATDDTEPVAADPVQTLWSVPATSIPATDRADSKYLNKITFLGDSTTYGLAYYGVVPLSQVWTRRDGTLALFNIATDNIRVKTSNSDTDMTIAQAAALIRPEILTITVGVNGISIMSETAFCTAFRDLISNIRASSPDTRIILNSIYPVTAAYEAKGGGINNAKIRTANAWIASIAEEYGLPYIDSYSQLAGEDGALMEIYCNGDGMHLSRAGFDMVINNIMEHAIV